jgi:hypothetical protein
MPGARAMAAATLSLAVLCAPLAYGDMTIEPSGVTLVAPRDAECPAIVLPFGAASPYATDRRDALYDGIDIKLSEGAPLLAIAKGKVISVGAGAASAGHYAWLQHAPDDTGLPFWVYSTYRHFDPVPELAVGSVVKVGQIIGRSGKPTYPNFHLSTLVSASDRYDARGRSVVVAGARLVDPAIVYVRGLRGLGELQRRPPPMLGVLIPYVTDDGVINPEKSRVIWPVACRRR